jgi:hypothetical protein
MNFVQTVAGVLPANAGDAAEPVAIVPPGDSITQGGSIGVGAATATCSSP